MVPTDKKLAFVDGDIDSIQRHVRAIARAVSLAESGDLQQAVFSNKANSEWERASASAFTICYSLLAIRCYSLFTH